MKTLLTTIQGRLRTDLANVRDRSIFVTEDELMIPHTVAFPAVALKDGPVVNTLASKTTIERKLQVRISAYSQVLKPEDSVMGVKGVLQLIDDIKTSLTENNLGLAGVYHAFPINEEASEIFGDEEEMIQKKTLVMEYQQSQPRSA